MVTPAKSRRVVLSARFVGGSRRIRKLSWRSGPDVPFEEVSPGRVVTRGLATATWPMIAHRKSQRFTIAGENSPSRLERSRAQRGFINSESEAGRFRQAGSVLAPGTSQ